MAIWPYAIVIYFIRHSDKYVTMKYIIFHCDIFVALNALEVKTQPKWGPCSPLSRKETFNNIGSSPTLLPKTCEIRVGKMHIVET